MNVVLNQASNTVAVGNLLWDHQKSLFARSVNATSRWMEIAGVGGPVSKASGLLAGDFKNTLTIIELKSKTVKVLKTPIVLTSTFIQWLGSRGEAAVAKRQEMKGILGSLVDDTGAFCMNFNDTSSLLQSRSIVLISESVSESLGLAAGLTMIASSLHKTWVQAFKLGEIVHDWLYSDQAFGGQTGAKHIEERIKNFNADSKNKLGEASPQIRNATQLILRESLVLVQSVSYLALSVLFTASLTVMRGCDMKVLLLAVSTATLALTILVQGYTYWNRPIEMIQIERRNEETAPVRVTQAVTAESVAPGKNTKVDPVEVQTQSRSASDEERKADGEALFLPPNGVRPVMPCQQETDERKTEVRGTQTISSDNLSAITQDVEDDRQVQMRQDAERTDSQVSLSSEDSSESLGVPSPSPLSVSSSVERAEMAFASAAVDLNIRSTVETI